jgi:hypothetical protein
MSKTANLEPGSGQEHGQRRNSIEAALSARLGKLLPGNQVRVGLSLQVRGCCMGPAFTLELAEPAFLLQLGHDLDLVSLELE